MKLKELVFHPPLLENDIRTIEDLYWILKDVFHYRREEIPFHYEDDIDEKQFFFFWDKILNIPIQYVLGYGYFLGYKFILNNSVLIPRNETEELVIQIVDKFFNKKHISVLDIGTGSGAILLTLEIMAKKRNIKFKGLGIDISKEALKIANLNKEKYSLESNFLVSDVFDNLSEEDKFEIIVSNPPYIAKHEFVDERVKKNEPHLALYADNNGLYVYEKIIKTAPNHLKKNGVIALEISPERKNGLIDLIEKNLQYNKYEFLKDINGFVRFLIIYLK